MPKGHVTESARRLRNSFGTHARFASRSGVGVQRRAQRGGQRQAGQGWGSTGCSRMCILDEASPSLSCSSESHAMVFAESIEPYSSDESWSPWRIPGMIPCSRRTGTEREARARAMRVCPIRHGSSVDGRARGAGWSGLAHCQTGGRACHGARQRDHPQGHRREADPTCAMMRKPR